MSAAWPATEPTEVGIAAGDARLVVDLRGGAMRALTVGDRELLDGLRRGHGARRQPRPGAAALAQPDPRRPLELGRPGPAAGAGRPGQARRMHGAGRLAAVERARSSRRRAVTVGTVVEARSGYPFRLAAAIDHALDPGPASP
jgi:aldose 1-epimerase